MIPPGQFEIRDQSGYPVTVQLTHPFELTSEITQKKWAEIMGTESVSEARREELLDIARVSGTVWSLFVFANRLSEAEGLHPVYDLRGVTFEQGTYAEDGTLKAISGELKINAPNGDIYQAEGYRLPTEAEAEYIQRLKANGFFHLGNVEAELKDYAWYREYRNGKPLLLRTQASQFYNLRENVWELGYPSSSYRYYNVSFHYLVRTLK